MTKTQQIIIEIEKSNTDRVRTEVRENIVTIQMGISEKFYIDLRSKKLFKKIEEIHCVGYWSGSDAIYYTQNKEALKILR